MAHYRKSLIAASMAVTVSLTGCGGGGGGGGGGPASTPAPPSTPTNPPAASIGAPAIAAVPNAILFPDGVTGGPTIQAHSTTVFPLLQTAMSISPGDVSADATTINAGATLTSRSTENSFRLNLGNPALEVSNADLNPTSSGVYKADLGGGAAAFLNISDQGTSNLSWTSYGFWAVEISSAARTETAFVTGYETPAGSVPTTGSATYNGSVMGEAFHPQAGRENGVNYSALSGNATLQANFASGNITGSLTNMVATGFESGALPWNSVSLVATISGGQFTGTSAAASAPGNSASLSGSATGTIAGAFFGPNAQELGAVWTLHDGTSSAIGSIGATTAPPDDNPWDY